MSYDLNLINRKTKEAVRLSLCGIQQYGGIVSWNPEARCINDVDDVLTFRQNRDLVWRCI